VFPLPRPAAGVRGWCCVGGARRDGVTPPEGGVRKFRFSLVGADRLSARICLPCKGRWILPQAKDGGIGFFRVGRVSDPYRGTALVRGGGAVGAVIGRPLVCFIAAFFGRAVPAPTMGAVYSYRRGGHRPPARALHRCIFRAGSARPYKGVRKFVFVHLCRA